MRLVLFALVISSPAYADVGSAFRGNPTWDFETVNGASLDKLRAVKKAHVRCRVDTLDENANVSIRVQLRCGAKKFAIAFDDAGGDLVFPFTKAAQVQKLKIRGKERDVWLVQHGTRAIGFLPELGPVLLCDSIKPFRCLRLAPEPKLNLTQADAQRMMDLLTAEGDDSWRTGDMSRRKPGADLSAQLDAAKGGGSVAVGGGGSRGGGMAGTGGTGLGKIGGPADTKSEAKVASGHITLASKSTSDTTSLTPDVVAAKILSAYMAGMRRCYKHVLAKDPSARGKLDIALAVTETGRARPKVSGFAQELDSCVQSLALSWRFPIPKDADGEATTATFKLSFKLVPE